MKQNSSEIKWTRVGTNGMQSGEYRCGKFFIDGATLYVVTHGETPLKTCADWDQAQKVVEAHRAGKDYEGI